MGTFETSIARSQEYAPYNGMGAFWCGYREYVKGTSTRNELSEIERQAYDRGAELAMKLSLGH